MIPAVIVLKLIAKIVLDQWYVQNAAEFNDAKAVAEKVTIHKTEVDFLGRYS